MTDDPTAPQEAQPEFAVTGDDAPADAEPVTEAPEAPKNDPVPEDDTPPGPAPENP